MSPCISTKFMEKNVSKKPRVPSAFKKKPKLSLRSTKLWTFALLIGGIGIFAAGSYVWYTSIYTNPDRIFYGMINKSLETSSITRSVLQEESGRTETQQYLVTFSPTPMVQSRSKVEQVDETRNKSAVATESIGNNDVDYVRYTAINVPQVEGAPQQDYSKILNTWARREANPEQGQEAQFLNEAIFTFVPFGNFSQENRAKLVNMMQEKKVYQLKSGKIRYENSRPVYEVNVSINPQGLVAVLKEYASLTGLGNMDQLDPTQYENSNSFDVKMEIDMMSRHLRQINYPGDTRVETYMAYGLLRKIESPTNTITLEELQGRIQ